MPSRPRRSQARALAAVVRAAARRRSPDRPRPRGLRSRAGSRAPAIRAARLSSSDATGIRSRSATAPSAVRKSSRARWFRADSGARSGSRRSARSGTGRRLGIEQGGEEGRAIEARPAEPVDRAVAGDQRRAAAIADQRVVVDGRVDSCADAGRGTTRLRIGGCLAIAISAPGFRRGPASRSAPGCHRLQ